MTPDAEDAEDATAASVAEIRRVAGPLFATMQHSGMAMAVTDPHLPDNPIVFVNEAFSALTGYPPEEAIGRNCRFLQTDETDPGAVASIRVALEAGRQVDVEIHNRRKDGSTFWNKLCIAPVPSQGGEPRFYFSTQVDCSTEHAYERAEGALRQTEAELVSVHERLDAALDATGAGAAWDWHVPEGRIFGDRRFAALYGLDAERIEAGIAPAEFFAIVHPDDRARIRLAAGAVLRGAEVFAKEFRIVSRGSVRWVRARGRCHRGADGAALRFGGVLIDVTEHKIVEEQLRIAQTAGGIGTFTHIDGFATADVSTQFCRLLGLQPADALPVRTINAVADRGGPALVEDQGVHRAGDVRHAEVLIRRPTDGEERWIACRGEYAPDSEATGLRFTGVVYDVTEAKRTEGELRRLNDRLASSVEATTRDRDRVWEVSRDMLGVADGDGVWLSVNPAWTRILGWGAEDVLGRNSDWLEEDGGRRTREALAEIAPDRTTVSFEGRFRTASGERRDLAWTFVSDEGRLYAAARDLTEEKARAAALSQAEEALRQAQKMEAVGQLTGGVAHDFNNLLTVIRSSTDLLRRADLPEARRKRYLDAVSDTVDRAAKLTRQLLAFARRQALKPEVFDAADRVRATAELLNTVTGARIAVRVEIGDEPANVRADPSQFETALVNMAVNARDAMDGEGTLTLRLVSGLPMPALRGHAGSDGPFVAVSLGDTGAGISAETMARIFEPFFTTKEVGKGTGLGLSQVFGFAKQSGGDVGVESELGRGTTFTLYLPQIAAEVQPSAPERDEERPSLGEGRRVLVVEDNVEIGQFATQVLQDLGYRTVWAPNALEALSALTEDAGGFDVVFSDVVMPGMNGVDLAQEIRRRHPGLPVVLTSGYSHVLAQGGTRGFELLHKPYSAPQLSRVLGQAIHGGRSAIGG